MHDSAFEVHDGMRVCIAAVNHNSGRHYSRGLDVVKMMVRSMIQYFKKPDDGCSDPIDITDAPDTSIHCPSAETEKTEVTAVDEQ